MSFRFLLIFIDLILVFIAFSISVAFKPSDVEFYIDLYLYSLLVFGVVWLVNSLIFKKFVIKGKEFKPVAKNVLISNISSLAVITLLMFLFYTYNFSRIIVFGTIGFATALEYIVFGFWFIIKQSHEIVEQPVRARRVSPVRDLPTIVETDKPEDKTRKRTIRKAIVDELGEEVYRFFNKSINLAIESTLIVSTTTKFNIDNQPSHFFNTIVNLKRVNDIRWINKFFESVNSKTPRGGVFICMAETKNLRKKRLLNKFPPIINYIYYAFDYIIKRIFPKFSLTKGIYFFLTRGENRVITRAELLGRLYSCGFEVLDERYIDNQLYVVCRKIKLPAYDMEATYGPLIKLRRIGKGGKDIKVYKMRTMHPYAEYLQEYVYQKHSLQEGGKFKDDFRISTIGKVMRKLWIDELPMFINFFRGELKIVGVRPLSKHYFNLYSRELQERRIKYKPGLVPPFYADKPKTLDEIMASEIKYFDAYDKSPLLTDVRYFFAAFYNIVFKKYRSN